jgi:hypothetical protein
MSRSSRQLREPAHPLVGRRAVRRCRDSDRSLRLILPKESEELAIDAPGFDAECRAEAAKEATAEA